MRQAEWRPSGQTRWLIAASAMADGNRELEDTVALAAAEFREKRIFGDALPVMIHGFAGDAEERDLLIELCPADHTEGHPEEFVIDCGPGLRVTSYSERGMLYALRTVLQRLMSAGRIEAGRTVERPAVDERAVFIDIARKYYSKRWIIERIKDMSWLKLNTLQLHFSENEGFRVESEFCPEMVSPEHLTKKEIKEILAVARQYHVAIVPSLDSPGHLGKALAHRPDWLLKDADHAPAKGALDLANPDAKAFVFALLDEYAELFAESRCFHIGGDEFIPFDEFDRFPELQRYAKQQVEGGTGIDAYVAYLNGVAAHLEAKGFATRVWNDGLLRLNQTHRTDLRDSVDIAYWTSWDANMAPVQAFLAQGRGIVNYNDAFLYYVLGENAGYAYPTGEAIYTQWHPGKFPSGKRHGPQEWKAPYPKQLKGASFAIWSDRPEAQTEDEVAAGSYDAIAAMAEKSWSGRHRFASYPEFQTWERQSRRTSASV